MKKTALVFILIASAVYGAGADLYRERTGDVQYRITFTKQAAPGGYALGYRSPEMEFTCVTGPGFAVKTWDMKEPGQGTSITGTRSGNEIKLRGTFRNAPADRDFTVDSLPWYQFIEPALERFVAGGRESMRFWIVNSEDLKLMKMEARRQGVETVSANGAGQKARRVRVRLTGFASAFWHADYWFRVSDNRFVRYESVRGGPGTPKTVIERIR